MTKGVLALAMIYAGAISQAARAEVPGLPPQRLREQATHIVVGTVQKIYSSTSRDKEWETTDYVAEIAIESVEKGDRLEPGDVAYVRYWRTSWIGSTPPPPHASGHRFAANGEAVRAFLVQNKRDKGLDAILPNGIEIKAKKGG